MLLKRGWHAFQYVLLIRGRYTCHYVLHKKGWHTCHYVLLIRGRYTCHYMLHKRGWHTIHYTLLNKRLIHWPLYVTQEGLARLSLCVTYKRPVHLQLCVTQQGLARLPLYVSQEGLARLPLCVTYFRNWYICHYVSHKDWHTCHYVLRTYKRLIHLPLCVTQEKSLHEGLARWPAFFTQDGDWYVCQYVLLNLFTIMHYSTGMLAIRCCLSGAGVLAIMHFWHACNVLLNRLAYIYYIRCCVVVTVIGVFFILKTDLLACLLERKAKVCSPVDDCHSVATIHHIIFLQMLFSTQIFCWLYPVLISYHK